MNNVDHLHGGAPRIAMARLGLAERAVTDFSVNLNPFGPPEVIKRRWTELFQAIEPYPALEGEGVARFYWERFRIPPRGFLAGNGSTEVIYLIPRVLNLKRVVVVTPSYHDYERASLLASSTVVRQPLSPGNEFAFPDMSQISAILEDADALWMGRPNNPTGTMASKEVVLELAGKFPKKWFIVDEAFIQFLNDWEDASLLTEQPRPNLLVIHSLTKFYALAGLRIGGVAGSEEVISRLRKAKEPWTVNGLADRTAPLLLQCVDYERMTQSALQVEVKRVFKALQNLNGFKPFPPSANFILCQWTKTRTLDDLLIHLISNGVYIRDCRNFPGLEENFLRIGLRASGENDRLLHLLSSF